MQKGGIVLEHIKEYLTRHALKCILIGFVGALCLVGAAGGAFVYAESPQMCGSCHSMTEEHASWMVSSHKKLNCTDCHLPHESLAGTLMAKAQTGMKDAYHEVRRDYPAHIKLSAEGREIVDKNCLRCHENTVEKVSMQGAGQDCVKCHSSVAHGSKSLEGGIKVE